MSAKVISLNKKADPTGCIVEKISIEECKGILNNKGFIYTDGEILIVREFIHQLAEINYLFYLKWKEQNEKNVIDINKNNEHETQSHTLHTGKYRRTG